MTVTEIKAAIDKLSESERAQLNELLYARDDDDAWDRQMREDISAGKLDHLIRAADEAIKCNDLLDMP